MNSRIILPPQAAALLGPQATAELCRFFEKTINAQVDRHNITLALEAMHMGLVYGVGEKWADILRDAYLSKLTVSNAEIAARHGMTRAAVSRRLIQCRRNLAEYAQLRIQILQAPNNARPKRTKEDSP